MVSPTEPSQPERPRMSCRRVANACGRQALYARRSAPSVGSGKVLTARQSDSRLIRGVSLDGRPGCQGQAEDLAYVVAALSNGEWQHPNGTSHSAATPGYGPMRFPQHGFPRIVLSSPNDQVHLLR